MPRRIISWKINELCDEPRVTPSLSTASFVMVITEATGIQLTEIGAKLTNWLASVKPAADESFVRHDTYFFKDGNITFLVDGTLYCVHRYFLSRDSIYFSTKFSQLNVRDHEPLNTIISLGDVERKDFDAFLSVIYPEKFEEHDLSYDQWKSVLHLSTRWGFASLRNLALRSIKPPTAFDQLLLARTYDVDHWVLPALSALCKMTTPISLEEACQMGIEDVVVVATVREEIRAQRPFVDAAMVNRQIKATQARMITHVTSDDVTSGDTPVSSESGSEKEPPKAVTSIGAKADSYNVTKEVTKGIPSKAKKYDFREEVSKAVPSKVDSYNVTEEVAVAASEAVDIHWSDEHLFGTASDSTAEFPIQKRGKKIKKGRKKKTSVRYDTENSEVDMTECETILGDDGAEYVADNAGEGVSGKPAMDRTRWPWLSYR